MTDNIVMCFLGSTNKTDAIIDFMPTWMDKYRSGEIIVFDPWDRIVATYHNNVDYIIKHDKDFKWIDHLFEKYQYKKDVRKLLVLNGADHLFPKPKEKYLGKIVCPVVPRNFLELLMRKRNMNMDIIIAFQTPESIPIQLERFVTDFIVLPVTEEYEMNKNNPNQKSTEICIKTINEYHKLHCKDARKEYLHIVIDQNEIIPSPSINKKKMKKIINKLKDVKRKVEIEN